MVVGAHVCLLAAVWAGALANDYRDVLTDQGVVRGYNVDREDAFSFYGIPYATAPSGENKFKAPLPGPKWEGVFEATVKDIICPQRQRVREGQEPKKISIDCLKINVYTPKTNETNLPVMLYVHGGRFTGGSGAQRLPLGLVEKGIIAVDFNYRVGVHGFLCLGTELAPGNAGYKDQVAAMKWVQRNIANFGGDPSNVNLVGGSSGSMAVDLQVLSPMTRGLFKRAVCHSGSSLISYIVNKNPLYEADKFANQFGVFTNGSLEKLEEFYRSIPDEDLNVKYNSSQDNYYFSIGFTSCIERHHLHGEEKFLVDEPIEIFKKGTYEKRTMLTGFTSMEGLVYSDRYEQDKQSFETNFGDYLPTDIKFDSEEQKQQVAKEVKDFYFPTGEITLKGFAEYHTDWEFAHPQYVAAKLHSRNKVPVYLFVYTYDSDPASLGPSHLSEESNIFDRRGGDADLSNTTLKVQQSMREMWVNFFKTGVPTPKSTDLITAEWLPLNKYHTNYLEIGAEIRAGQSPLAPRFALWDRVYRPHHLPPRPHRPHHKHHHRHH